MPTKGLELNDHRGNEWRITKKQVVCSELSRAIRLFIEDNDFVCAHLIAGAVAEILRSLAEKAGKEAFREHFKDRLLPEFYQPMMDRLNAEYNFFKHGARDADVVWDRYHPAITEFLLFECCCDFQTVFGGRYLETNGYHCWFALRHRDLWVPGTSFATHVEALNLDIGDPLSDDIYKATRGLADLLKFGAEVGPACGLPILSREGVVLSEDRDSSRNPSKYKRQAV